MSWFYKPYVSAAQRRANGSKQITNLKKSGMVIEPLGELSHRLKIATSFWGKAWCDHLESLGDYQNRLPRGRTYVRNGSVLHLAIEPGKITALVQGSDLYKQTIEIEPLTAAKWNRIKKRCGGSIGSLIELLQGKVSDEIMAIVTDPKDGLFPSSKEIHLNCSCPDWASLCKHLAAILYGVGARLDQQPELLFKLRGVDHRELIDESVTATALEGATRTSGRRTLDSSSLGDVFGIELDSPDDSPPSSGTLTTPKKRGRKQPQAVATTTEPKLTAPFHPTGASVRELREAIHLSRPEFAEWIGVSPQSVTNWEKQGGPLKLQARSLESLEALHRGLQTHSEPS